MRNVRIIITNEIKTILGKRSFWIVTFVLPAVILLINIGAQLAIDDEMATAETLLPSAAEEGEMPTFGYVDAARIIQAMPPDLPQGIMQPYQDEAAANAALTAGEIDRYLLIPADFLQGADPIIVEQTYNPLGSQGEALFEYVLTYNLVGRPGMAQALVNPTAQVERQPLAPAETAPAAENNMLATAVPFATLFIFFLLITTSSGYMLRSVAREKENRTMEVLLVSLEPHQLMVGKVVGLGLIGLLQMLIWVGGGSLLLSGGVPDPVNLGSISLPDGFVIWALLYFLGGYFLYASLMGILGALAPNAREAGQFTFFLLLPLMVPLWLNATITGAPNGPLAVALSLFPLTAPVTMMTRLADSAVPLWQLLLGVVGLLLTAYLCAWLASRFFRGDTLLSSAPLRWQRFFREWRTSG